MSSAIFDYVRRTAREYINYEIRKDIKSETGISTHIVSIIFEKVQGDLIDGLISEGGGLTVANHSCKWNLKYWLSTEKSGGFDTAIDPISLSDKAEKLLEKLSMTAILSCNVRVIEKKTVLTIYGLPDNDTSRSVIDDVYKVVVRPLWGDIDADELSNRIKTDSRSLEKKDVDAMLKELDGWTLEADTIAKTLEFGDHYETMNFVSLLTIMSRQEETSVGILANENSVKVYLKGMTVDNYKVARRIDVVSKTRN